MMLRNYVMPPLPVAPSSCEGGGPILLRNCLGSGPMMLRTGKGSGEVASEGAGQGGHETEDTATHS
jgi:hypothetical protein